jgi:tetratricopeptide (TPR) repeat protein
MIAKLPPESTESLWGYKCDFELALGRLDSAHAVVVSAPGEAQWKNSMFAQIELYKHNYPEALKILATISPKEPSDAINEAQIQGWRGEEEKERTAFTEAGQMLDKRISQRPNDPILLGYRALCYAGLGQKEDALASIQRAAAVAPLSQDSIDGANWMGTLAEVDVLTGEAEAALDQFAKVVKLPNGPSYGDLKFNPEWDIIRNDPRFQEILAQALMPPAYN